MRWRASASLIWRVCLRRASCCSGEQVTTQTASQRSATPLSMRVTFWRGTPSMYLETLFYNRSIDGGQTCT